MQTEISKRDLASTFSIQRIGKFIGKNYLLFSLILLIVAGTLVNDAFLSTANLKGLLFTVAIYGLLAVGQSLNMLVSELNLTLGASMAFSPILAIWIARNIYAASGVEIVRSGVQLVGGVPLIVFLVLLISVLVGVTIGSIRVKFGVSSLIISLGMSYLLQGSSYIISNSNLIYLSEIKNINWLGTAAIGPFPVSFLIFLLIGIVLILLMKYTRFGLRLYSTGGNEKAAVYSGVNTKMWKIIALGISGFCAGLAALMYSSRMESIDPIQGEGLQFYALSIAIIGGISVAGGKGSLSGTLMASAVLVIILNIMQIFGLASWYQTIMIGAIILIASSQAIRKPAR